MRRILFILALFLIPSLAQAQGSLLPDTLQQFTDSLGVPLASGFVCTTLTGTTTNLATYPTAADANAGTNANTNPVLLDSAGRGTIWLGTGTYRIAVYAAVALGVSGTCNGVNVGPAVKTVNGVAGPGAFFTAGNITYLGIATPNTGKANLEVGCEVGLNPGDRVRIFGCITRLGTEGTGGVWPLNTNTTIPSGTRNGPAYAYEADINNNDTDSAITNAPADQQIGIISISGGTKKPLAAFASRSTNSSDRWLIAGDFADWSTYGVRVTQPSGVTGPALAIVSATSAGVNSIISLLDENVATERWRILQNGSMQFANNAPIYWKDTGGVYRVGLLMGGDDTVGLYAGNSGTGELRLQAGTAEFQWNAQGITSPVKATFNASLGQGTALKHARAASCTTAASAGATCDTTLTWAGTAFADANYTATCTMDTGSNVSALMTATKTTGTMVVQVVALTAAAASGTINCMAFHD